jgi:hypothetical protein
MNILATKDRAQHWTSLTPIPPGTQQLDACMIFPDAADPSIVVAAVSGVRYKDLTQEPPQQFVSDFAQFVTFDGGAQWQPLHSPEPFLLQWLATYHGTTLAMLERSDGSIHLWSSTDQMQTWHELAHAPSGNPFINPVTGDLRVLDNNGNNLGYINQGYIFESTDLGRHGSSHPIPSELSGVPVLVCAPVAGQPWRVCGTEGPLTCSMDSGRTWTSPPQLATTFYNTDKGLVVPETAQPVAVGADGTIYAVVMSDLQPIRGIPAGLYRLTLQATRWQPVPLPPGGAGITTTVDTTDLPGSGILWAVAGSVPGEINLGWAGPFPAASV